MTAATTTTEEVQEQVLGLVRKGREVTLSAINQVNAAAEKLPAVPGAGKLPQLPSLSRLPGVSALPEPETVVSATFDFLDRLLAGQRKFAGELVKAASGPHPAAGPGPAAAEAPPAAE